MWKTIIYWLFSFLSPWFDLPGLPKLKINQMAISGFSSGGFFAQQMYLAHSELFVGMATLSGGPFLCHLATPNRENLPCLFTPEDTNLTYIYQETQRLEMEGLLSPNEGRKGHRIYLWHGSQDSVVPASSAINSYSFLHQLLPPSASIYLDNKVPANHGLSSLHRGSPCGQRENRESFVERCNVSTVHRMLNHLFGPNQPLPEENQENNLGLEHNLKEFNQRRYIEHFPNGHASLASFGFIYIPQKCYTQNCHLLIFLHGCLGAYEYTGKEVILQAGFLPELEKRGIVGLFPQIKSFDFNPMGCWNWADYQPPSQFYTKKGWQIRALKNMIDDFY